MATCLSCGKIAVFGNLCWTCQHKEPVDRLDKALSLDLHRLARASCSADS